MSAFCTIYRRGSVCEGGGKCLKSCWKENDTCMWLGRFHLIERYMTMGQHRAIAKSKRPEAMLMQPAARSLICKNRSKSWRSSSGIFGHKPLCHSHGIYMSFRPFVLVDRSIYAWMWLRKQTYSLFYHCAAPSFDSCFLLLGCITTSYCTSFFFVIPPKFHTTLLRSRSAVSRPFAGEGSVDHTQVFASAGFLYLEFVLLSEDVYTCECSRRSQLQSVRNAYGKFGAREMLI